jgi:hypothetical protein
VPRVTGDPLQVAYCSNPTAPGGPFRSGPGRAVFWDQRLRQRLEKPNLLVNSVQFKGLGLIPGVTEQLGEVKILDGKQYQVSAGNPRTAWPPSVAFRPQGETEALLDRTGIHACGALVCRSGFRIIT